MKEKKDYAETKQKIRGLSVYLDPTFYLENPHQYEKVSKQAEMLDAYIRENGGIPVKSMTVNELSLEIFGDEKFLKSHPAFLKNFKLSIEDFGASWTIVPVVPVYHRNYEKPLDVPRTFLIAENLDTYHRMIAMPEKELGIHVDTVIYGSGKLIESAFENMLVNNEPCYRDKGSVFYYFGDIDYEGIGIYQRFAREYPNCDIRLFTAGYRKLLKKNTVEKVRTKQKEINVQNFLNEFSSEEQEQITRLLKSECYIAQESLFDGGEDL